MHHKWKSFDVWSLRYGVRQTEFFLFLDHFLSSYSPSLLAPSSMENQNFEKMKKMPGVIITLHKCTINDNHMMYGSWDMKPNRNKFLSFWPNFCPFYSINNPKNQNFGKMKTMSGSIPKIAWHFPKTHTTLSQNNFPKICLKQLKLSDHIDLEKWNIFAISNL